MSYLGRNYGHLGILGGISGDILWGGMCTYRMSSSTMWIQGGADLHHPPEDQCHQPGGDGKDWGLSRQFRVGGGETQGSAEGFGAILAVSAVSSRPAAAELPIREALSRC